MTVRSKPSWSDVKGRLADFDYVGLIALVHRLFAAIRQASTALHTARLERILAGNS